MSVTALGLTVMLTSAATMPPTTGWIPLEALDQPYERHATPTAEAGEASTTSATDTSWTSAEYARSAKSALDLGTHAANAAERTARRSGTAATAGATAVPTEVADELAKSTGFLDDALNIARKAGRAILRGLPLLGVGALGLVGLAGALAGTSSSKGEDPSTRPDDSSKTPEPPDSGRVDVHDHPTRID